MTLPAFKAYDIRGRVPSELNEDIAGRIGVALAAQLGPGAVVLGRDVRLSSPALQQALSAGLRSAGREVIDIGQCGTEEVYFQTDHLGAAGGVMVTASHNPMDYNGMKLVRENVRSAPIPACLPFPMRWRPTTQRSARCVPASAAMPTSRPTSPTCSAMSMWPRSSP